MKIALHICCGVCAAGVAERLAAEGHQIHGFFYNPNIQPRDEYERRLAATEEVARRMGFPLAVGAYVPDDWLALTQSLAAEPEGGLRCVLCFRLRLAETCRFMQDNDCEAFTTTLSVSPHKDAALVNRVGEEIGGASFLQRDFKKRDGFTRTMALAREWAIYRQRYCGCVYSLEASR